MELDRVLVAEPIVGWRIWHCVPFEHATIDKHVAEILARAWDEGRNPFRDLTFARLTGVGYRTVWAGGRIETARCWVQDFNWSGLDMHDDAAPSPRCACGIWAFKDEREISAALAQYGTPSPSGYAYGRVQLWGRIIEHENGYRAEHARVIDATVIEGSQDVCDDLARFYGGKFAPGPIPPGVRHRAAESAGNSIRNVTFSAPVRDTFGGRGQTDRLLPDRLLLFAVAAVLWAFALAIGLWNL